MLRSLVRQASQARCYSQFAAPPPTRNAAAYFVPRNTKGSMPVYTDIRNGGTRHLTLIRNVQGDVSALANDLAQSLFQPGSPEATRMRIQTVNSRHLILSGGRWKSEVVRWLSSKGF